jgi:hypothetical protein
MDTTASDLIVKPYAEALKGFAVAHANWAEVLKGGGVHDLGEQQLYARARQLSGPDAPRSETYQVDEYLQAFAFDRLRHSIDDLCGTL